MPYSNKAYKKGKNIESVIKFWKVESKIIKDVK